MWTWARENPDLLSLSSIRPEATRMRGFAVPLREALTGSIARARSRLFEMCTVIKLPPMQDYRIATAKKA